MFSELLFVLFAIFVIWIFDHFSTLFGTIFFGCTVYYYVNSDSNIINRQWFVLAAARTYAAFSVCFQAAKKVYCFCKQLSTKNEGTVSLSPEANIQFCGSKASLENEINVLVLGISQHYIQSWYHKISDNEDFVLYLNSNIRDTLVNLCAAVSKLDKKFFSLITFQVYLNFFSHFVEAKKKSAVFQRENFELRHWAMKDDLTELCYLRSLMSTLLDSFCPTECERSLNSKLSPLLHNVVVEILTQNILNPILRVLCDPTRLNLLLLNILSNPVEIKKEKKPSDNASISEDSTIKEEQSNLKPMILLPNEELSDDSVFVDDPADWGDGDVNPPNMRFISDDCTLGSGQKFSFNKEPEFDIHGKTSLIKAPCEEISMFRWVNSKRERSSSNINLFDPKFSYSKVLDYSTQKDFSKPSTVIKRSKSADYICQMPFLKPLNGENYSIVVKGDNKMIVSFKSDSSEYIKGAAEKNVQVEISTLFTDIDIIDTETEIGVLPYTLYCIQYTGVFHDSGRASKHPHLVRHVIIIKRRFSQFVNLHSCLEANPQFRAYLKGIKGPSKWIFPFSNLDKKYIAERRSLLEKYLRGLCNLAPLAKSADLQEFLGYCEDARSSPTRKSTDINTPRVDKKMVRGVKDAYVMFKTSLPNSSEDDERISVIPKATSTDFYRTFQEYLVDVVSREPEICEHMRNFKKIKNQTPGHKKSSEPSKPKRTPLLKNMQSFKAIPSCKCPVLKEDFLLEDSQFGNTVMELIAVSLKLNDTKYGDPFSLLKSFCAPYISRFFETKLDNFSEDQIITSVHMLHKFLWPDEINSCQHVTDLESKKVVFSQVLENIKVFISSEFAILDLSCYVKEFLLDKINLFLLSLQNEEANKCLLFHMFDALIEEMHSKDV